MTDASDNTPAPARDMGGRVGERAGAVAEADASAHYDKQPDQPDILRILYTHLAAAQGCRAPNDEQWVHLQERWAANPRKRNDPHHTLSQAHALAQALEAAAWHDVLVQRDARIAGGIARLADLQLNVPDGLADPIQNVMTYLKKGA